MKKGFWRELKQDFIDYGWVAVLLGFFFVTLMVVDKPSLETGWVWVIWLLILVSGYYGYKQYILLDQVRREKSNEKYEARRLIKQEKREQKLKEQRERLLAFRPDLAAKAKAKKTKRKHGQRYRKEDE